MNEVINLHSQIGEVKFRLASESIFHLANKSKCESENKFYTYKVMRLINTLGNKLINEYPIDSVDSIGMY